jgi:hypothetical protein
MKSKTVPRADPLDRRTRRDEEADHEHEVMLPAQTPCRCAGVDEEEVGDAERHRDEAMIVAQVEVKSSIDL